MDNNNKVLYFTLLFFVIYIIFFSMITLYLLYIGRKKEFGDKKMNSDFVLFELDKIINMYLIIKLFDISEPLSSSNGIILFLSNFTERDKLSNITKSVMYSVEKNLSKFMKDELLLFFANEDNIMNYISNSILSKTTTFFQFIMKIRNDVENINKNNNYTKLSAEDLIFSYISSEYQKIYNCSNLFLNVSGANVYVEKNINDQNSK